MTHADKQRLTSRMTDNERPTDVRVDAMVEQVLRVAAAIGAASRGKPGTGRIPCPVCGVGMVGYSIAGSRSMAARCSTPGCVAFLS